MANIFDYLKWRGDILFNQVEINDVDSLILCRLSYIEFDNIVPEFGIEKAIPLSQAVKSYLKLVTQGKTTPLQNEDIEFLKELMISPRFKDKLLYNYVNKIDADKQLQFSAVTIQLEKDTTYIAFRGTDNTLIGWKEDINMGFLPSVPAQLEAVEYLKNISATTAGRLYVGGHSKGGNLAVYSSSYIDKATQDRIVFVYNNDGPGFNDGVIKSTGYARIINKIKTFVPQSSVVGMLLGHEEKYKVIHSSNSGIMQHDLYSWDVLGNSFCLLENVDNSSKFIDKTLKEWVSNMSITQREQFFDALFQIIRSTKATTMKELRTNWFENTGVLLKTIKNTNEETKRLISKTLFILFTSAKNSLPEIVNNAGKDNIGIVIQKSKTY